MQASIGGVERDRARGGDRDLGLWCGWSPRWTALLDAAAANLVCSSCSSAALLPSALLLSSAARSAFSSSPIHCFQSLELVRVPVRVSLALR